jgi:exosortase family protein XrtM
MRSLRLLLQSNSREIRFFLGFVVLFVMLQSAHYFTRSYTAPFLVDTMTTRAGSALINIITPGEKTVVRDGAIIGGATVEIMRGCEGIEGMLLLIAAVLAFPARIRLKFYGIAGGILFIYAFNLARIAGLYYTIRYKPALFDMMHIYVGQTVIIIVSLIFFIFWLSRIERVAQNSR